MSKNHFSRIRLVLFMLAVFFLGHNLAFCQTRAHQRSAYAVIDPSYSSTKTTPNAQVKAQSVPWIYGSAELETWRLALLQARKDSAKLNVGYPGVYHKPFQALSFQHQVGASLYLDKVSFRAVGKGQVFINDQLVAEFEERNTLQTLVFKSRIKTNTLRFELSSMGNPPALLIENPAISTALKTWKWKAGNMDWEAVTAYPQNTQNLPPHLLEDPTILVKPSSVSQNVVDFGKEVYGYIVIKSQSRPVISVGESETEALDLENKKLEQSLEIVQTIQGQWKTKNPLAFRFVHLENANLETISCEALFYPAVYKGAFACSDTILTKIWMNSAYTLRLCMHDFLLDGIKRDRLPWTGDLAMSMMVNSFTFGDAELVRRSLVALGRAGIAEKDINGIVDYSLWWIIAQDQYQLFYGDKAHLNRERGRIKEALKVLSSRCDDQGFLNAKNTWLFIDWVNQDKWTALQIMWWWAQNSSVKLAERMGDAEMASFWKKSSEKLKANLTKTAWDDKAQIWLSSAKDTAKENTRHPNFMAVVSGLTSPTQSEGIFILLENETVKPVGTPYMAGFEMMARAQLGNIDYTLQKISAYWGGMMARGATSFWEAYDPNELGAKQYAYYGRPYAKSLCHAWSSGPAAILPSQILGLRPLADGWQKFTLNPKLGTLKWVSVNVPSKFGSISVDIEQQNMEVIIPAGAELEWKGQSFKGPRVLKTKL